LGAAPDAAFVAASLLGRMPDGSLRTVIAHELAHLRRRDHWIAFVQLVAECVWWWNPLFWFIRRQIRLNAELACDAWVVSTLPEQRRAYAEALIEISEQLSRRATPAFALGVSNGCRRAFEKRLTMIMSDRSPCKISLAGLLLFATLSLAALPAWAQFREFEEEPVGPAEVNVPGKVPKQEQPRHLADDTVRSRLDRGFGREAQQISRSIDLRIRSEVDRRIRSEIDKRLLLEWDKILKRKRQSTEKP